MTHLVTIAGPCCHMSDAELTVYAMYGPNNAGSVGTGSNSPVEGENASTDGLRTADCTGLSLV